MGSRIGSPVFGRLGCDQLAAPDPTSLTRLFLHYVKLPYSRPSTTPRGRILEAPAGLRIRMQPASPQTSWPSNIRGCTSNSAHERLGLIADILFRFLGSPSSPSETWLAYGPTGVAEEPGGHEAWEGVTNPGAGVTRWKRVGGDNAVIVARCPVSTHVFCKTRMLSCARARTGSNLGSSICTMTAYWLRFICM